MFPMPVVWYFVLCALAVIPSGVEAKSTYIDEADEARHALEHVLEHLLRLVLVCNVGSVRVECFECAQLGVSWSYCSSLDHYVPTTTLIARP